MRQTVWWNSTNPVDLLLRLLLSTPTIPTNDSLSFPPSL
jgi:hypothetical protein